MRDDTTTQPVVFKDLFGKPVVACFDQPDSSSDGGAVLLKACDDRLGLTEAIAACVDDARQPGKVIHRFHDLVRQRVFGIACGYEDCNDAERLAEDPMQNLLVDRDAIEGSALASQSTLSRFENALGPKALMHMGNALADTVRTDTGNGACETVYLSEFEVINKANAGMRSFYQLAKWFTILAMIGYVVAFFNAPVHQRYR